ncbi:MAG: immunoglobulin-like domain-containing protein [Sedimentisphaerales bacterium]
MNGIYRQGKKIHRSYSFALIISLVFGVVAEAGWPDYSPLEEAQILAINISGQLQAHEELTQRILNDLAAIREAYPDIAGIRYRAPYVAEELMVRLTAKAAEQFKAGQYHGLDELNGQYGVIETDAGHLYHGSLNLIVLKFDKFYNAELLSDIYEQAQPEGLVYAEPDYIVGDGDTIQAQPPDYNLVAGWGDCPAGCIYNRSYHFRVENGQASLLEITGPGGLEVWVPMQYPTIQSAIDAADDNDTIFVQPGTYYENINLRGRAIRVTSADGPSVTIIDGNGTGPVVQCSSGEEPNTALDGFTITGGDTNLGGGMYNENSGPTIVNCIFRNNTAESGGAVFNKNSNPIISNCIFWKNHAGNGGGIYDDNSTPVISNCTFSQNSASGNGGELCDSNESNTVATNCIFRDVYEPPVFNSSFNSPFEHGVIDTMINLPGPVIYADSESHINVTYSDVGSEWLFFGHDNIAADPCFIDAAAGDFRLRPDSPCIDAGDNNNPFISRTDLNKKPRIFGASVDMGALEYSPNLPPMACIAQGNRTIEATGKQTKVVFDGSLSMDYDSMAGTNDDINSFEWFLRDPNAVMPSNGGPMLPPLPGDSYDPNNDIPIGTGEIIECNLPAGEYGVVLKVTDKGNLSNSSVTKTIIKDTTPPVITLNGDETVTVKQKSGSYKERGATASDAYDGAVRVIIGGDKVQSTKCGRYVVTYDAVDSAGNAARQVKRTVIVADTKRPYFRLWVRPRVLRPLNYQMVQVRPEWVVRDNSGQPPEVTLVSIVAVEHKAVVSDMSNGDDITISGDGAIYLRAERSKINVRRIYIITYQATDNSGNITTRQAKVSVSRHQD